MMINVRVRRAFCALLAGTAIASPALAQQDADFVPPVRQAIDENGVDLSTGQMSLSTSAISIGSTSQLFSYQRTLQTGSAVWDNPYQYAAYGTDQGSIQVVLGEKSVDFDYDTATGKYVNQQATGETLVGGGSTWTFTDRHGTVIQMDQSDASASAPKVHYYGNTVLGVAHSIIFADGRRLTLSYKAVAQNAATWLRLQSLQSSDGYMAKMEYADNAAILSNDWTRLTKVTLLNLAVDYCAPAADTCSYSTAWPSLTFSSVTNADQTKTGTITDTLNRRTVYSLGYGGASNGKIQSIQRPSSSTPNTVVSYESTTGRVAAVAIDGRTWSYSWSLATPLMTATITNPDHSQHVFVTDTVQNEIKSETDELGHTTAYAYDALGRLTDITYPEGNKAHYDYDSRGNVTTKRLVAKVPGSPADIVMTAAYPASCTNAVTCNEPTSTTDPKGNVTNYTYDPTHGGILTVTEPAPSPGAVQPQTRYGYSALQASFKNSAGSIAPSGQPTYLLTSISQCEMASSCSGTADEVKSTISYGSQGAGLRNNLLPVSVLSGSGDGVLTAAKNFTFDDVGNVTYVDGPLAGASDTSRIIYDAARQVIGQIEPDPDGAGSLLNRAVRTTYNSDGKVTKLERGTTTGQSDVSWSGFVPAEIVDVTYDSSGRQTTRKLSRGGTAYALTQSSYDSNGRLQCSAQRMNDAAFAALPSDACTLGAAGTQEQDRISKISYDAAGHPQEFDQGLGTADARAERVLTYTANGEVQTLKDAENNLTTYSYDGFDRLSKTQYPSTTKGAGTSSTSDYEQLGYDANSNITSRRLRDGTSIAYTYDNLNRLTSKDLPGTEPDVTYAYDNLGRLTSASQSGNALSFTFDALGRNLTETGPQGTITSAYDLAGNRTQVTYPGTGLSVNYDYLVTGEISKIRENGATSGVGVLASYGYDNLGNRTSLTFGNGVVQNYGYDPVSRLTSLTNDLAGTTNDLTISPIAYNPASQIKSAARAGDAYAFTSYAAVNRGYTSNGLNQYKTAGSASFTYDAKGNLTSDGTNTFGYSSENLLTSGPNSSTLAYDPLLRLYQLATPTATTRFAYDGLNMIAEYNASNALQRRYVFAPGIDQPVVWYEGTGTANRRFLSTDERGSVIAATDSTGALLGIDRYDEYGIPASTNLGRFQYTGQAWLSEVGLYYYKARLYSPTLGRFMQPDPIGYDGDGPNIYNYVLGDPVNGRDPAGFSCKAVYVVGERWHPSCDGDVAAGVAGSLTSPGRSTLDEPASRDRKPQKGHSLLSRIGNTCLGKIDAKTWAGLGVDAVGAVASFVPGGKGVVSAGAAVVGSTTGVTSIGLGISAHNFTGAGSAAFGAAGHYTSVAVGLLDGAKGVAAYLPVAAPALAIGGLLYDGVNALNDAGCFGGRK